MSEDDLEPLVTTCPNCGTRFKVTESQLQVAKGQVRCGACLTVFDGASALLLDGELVPQETEALKRRPFAALTLTHAKNSAKTM